MWKAYIVCLAVFLAVGICVFTASASESKRSALDAQAAGGNQRERRSSCSFKFNGCQVILASNEVCQSNPCLRGEYCKIKRGSLRCCQQLLVSDGIPSASRTTQRCSESCVLPPPRAPSPPFPVCPLIGDDHDPSTTPVVVTNSNTPPTMPAIHLTATRIKTSDNSITVAVTWMLPNNLPTGQVVTLFQLTYGTGKNSATSQFISLRNAVNGKFTRLFKNLLGNTCYKFKVRSIGSVVISEEVTICTGPSSSSMATAKPPTATSKSSCSFVFNNCQVTLASNEVCQSNPCRPGEYCKIKRGSLRCCQQLSVSDGIPSALRTTRRCSESCVLPPRLAHSPPLPVCPSQSGNPSVGGDHDPSTAPVVATTPSERTDSNTPTTMPVCPTPPAPRNGFVKVVGTIAGYRCREGYRIGGKNTRRCVDGELQGKTPRCKRANVGNGRCFVSVGGCTGCLRSKQVCNQDIRLKCPGGSYCKLAGSRKLPRCCSLSEDAFGRCSESCV